MCTCGVLHADGGGVGGGGGAALLVCPSPSPPHFTPHPQLKSSCALRLLWAPPLGGVPPGGTFLSPVTKGPAGGGTDGRMCWARPVKNGWNATT